MFLVVCSIYFLLFPAKCTNNTSQDIVFVNMTIIQMLTNTIILIDLANIALLIRSASELAKFHSEFKKNKRT